MKANDNLEQRLQTLGQSLGHDDDLIQAIMTRINAEQTTKTPPAPKKPGTWRIIMKTNISKLAAAVIIVAALIAGVYIFSGPGAGIALADVIAPILNAQTASLDIILGSGETQSVIHDDIMGSRIRRTVRGVSHSDFIIDLEQQKVLTLDHEKKTAVYVRLGGLDNMKNYLRQLQDLVARFEEKDEYEVENCGLQDLDGREYIVFVVTSEQVTITIWADRYTALPARIEEKTPNMLIVCDNLAFDVPLDEALFSMDVPEGYTIQESAVDFRDNNESDFIETLRIWAEIIEDGNFPDSISLDSINITEFGPKMDKALKRMNLTEKDVIQVATRWGQGLVFLRFFKGQGQWHYAGKGVKFGDAETPVFWYQPKDSETWRVIYGDLHVENVSPENLPQ